MANEVPNFLTKPQDQKPLDFSVDREVNYRIWDISVYTGNKLKIPKEVLDSLDKKFVWLQNQVIDLTKSDLGNLQNLITQAEATKDYTKVEEALRKELIEAQVDAWNVKLDVLSTWAKWTIPEAVLNKVWSYIDTKLNYDFLDNQHKENIKIAIVWKILSSWKVDELLNSFTDITKNWWNGIENIGTNFNTIIGTEMKDIISLLEKAKGDEQQKELIKKWLLSNPKAIQEYTEGLGISKIQKLEWPELVNLLSWMNNQVINLEKKWWNIKENLMATLSKMPSWLSEVILWFLSKILWFFLWEAQAEKLIWWFKKEIQNRKSVDNLLQYWNITNEKWESIAWAKNSKIALLNDKNLTWLESKKLSKFFDNCREKWIDITEDNFWEKVFNDKNVAVEKEEVKKDAEWKEIKDKDWKEIKEKVPHKYIFNIDDAKTALETKSSDFTKFYEVLNDPKFITDKTAEDVNNANEAKKIEEANNAKAKSEADTKNKIEGFKNENMQINSIVDFINNGDEKLKNNISNLKAKDIIWDTSNNYYNTLAKIKLSTDNPQIISLFNYVKQYLVEKNSDWWGLNIKNFLDYKWEFKTWLDIKIQKNKGELLKLEPPPVLSPATIPIESQSNDSDNEDDDSTRWDIS